jgi:hypothetical protein
MARGLDIDKADAATLRTVEDKSKLSGEFALTGEFDLGLKRVEGAPEEALIGLAKTASGNVSCVIKSRQSRQFNCLLNALCHNSAALFKGQNCESERCEELILLSLPCCHL